MNDEYFMARIAIFTGIVVTKKEAEKILIFMRVEELIKEIKEAQKQLATCADDYWAREGECSLQTKFVMAINNWASPFIACEELLKRIDTNEGLLKMYCKGHGTTFKEIGYKSCYKEMRALLQSVKSCAPCSLKRSDKKEML